MKTFRRFGLWLSGSLFRFLLVGSISVVALMLLLHTPDTTKDVLTSTNAYQRYTQGIINANRAEAGGLPLGDPALQNIIKDAFSPAFLQKQVEQAIDDVYTWLDGSQEQLDLRLDLTEGEERLHAGLRTYAVNRFSALPPCITMPATIDPFTTPCVPPGATEEQVVVAIDQAVAEKGSLLAQTVFTEDDILKDESGAPLHQRFGYIPTVFQTLSVLMYVLPTLALLCAVAIIALHDNRRKGIAQVGYGMLSVGFGIVVFTYVFGIIVPSQSQQLQNQLAGQAPSDIQALTSDVTTAYTAQLQQNFINIALYIAAVGLVVVAIERMSRSERPFAKLEKKSGLVSSVNKKSSTSAGKAKKYKESPLQSSEGTRKRSSTKGKKVKRILKGM